MKKLIILSFFILTSCGSRKVDTEKKDVKKDSLSEVITSKHVGVLDIRDSFVIKPFDNLKPMVIEGKTYNNVIIENVKSKTEISYSEITKTITIVKTVSIEKTKQVEKKASNIFLIASLVVNLILIVFLYTKKGILFF